MVERKKPKFFRQTWYKKVRLGKTVKKKRKWRAAKGRQSKVRLGERGRASKPKVGWGSPNKVTLVVIRNLKEMEGLKAKEIIIGSIGKKKREQIIKKAEEMKVRILNRYGVKNAA